MTRLLAHTAALALLALLPASLRAQDDDELLKRAFQRMDQDGDGKVARAEFAGSDAQFAAIDADHDGVLTFAEYARSEAARAFLRAAKRQGGEPRPRTSLAALAPLRLEHLARWDKNHDGKVTLDEWTGTPAAFAQLDLDHDGVLDARDRALALAQAPPPPPALPEGRFELPGTDDLLLRLDKDGDGAISLKEAAANKHLAEAFAFADQDGDGKLSRAELVRLQRELDKRRGEEQRERGRPQPYEVPFDAWDADKDGKVRQNEWQGPRDLFERIDLDHDSAVTREEVERYRRRVLGEDFVARFDLNGDGKVTLAEFGGPPAAFRRADRNGDGVITKGDR
jgi:Ca2+-binding EF-hand superfamily protein